MEVDHATMGLALAQAHRALGRTAPNPSVGAVVVRDGEVLGAGRTQPVGGNHAEVEAIRDAHRRGHADLRGATMYVTLEPCCHWGRTPPCTDLIVKEGLGRVVVGVVDPYPPMQGKGLARLRAAGVEVALGIRADEAAATVLGFTRTLTEGLPEVTLKAASSLDGNLATRTGESQWITGEEARADGHGLRASHDAIVVGIGTALADDPRLTCRAKDGKDPVPVVLDTELRLPLKARLLTAGAPPVVICAEDAPHRQLPADILRVPRARGRRGVDVEAALRQLARRGLHRVLVEGGGQVHRSILDEGLADTLHLYLSGALLPGGRSWLGGAPVDRLGDATRLPGPPDVRTFGPDVRLSWTGLHRSVAETI